MNKERNIIDEREVWITMEEKVKRDDGKGWIGDWMYREEDDDARG